MYNLLKAQFFGMRKNKRLLIEMAFVFFLPLLYALLASSDFDNAGELMADMQSMGGVVLLMAGMLILPDVALKDFDDKTINYEVLAGNSRSKIFCARVFLGLAISFFYGLICCWTPVLIKAGISGWGSNYPLNECLEAWGMYLCIFFRFLSEMVLLGFIFKGYLITVIGGLTIIQSLGMVGMVWAAFTDMKWAAKLGSFMSLQLRMVDFNQKMDFIDGKDTVRFFFNVHDKFFWWDTVGCVLYGVLCIIIAHYIFRKGDLK